MEGAVDEARDLETGVFSSREGGGGLGPEFGFGESDGGEEGEGLVEGALEEIDDGEGWGFDWEIGLVDDGLVLVLKGFFELCEEGGLS